MKHIGISLILCTATLLTTLSGCGGKQETGSETGFISADYKNLPHKDTVMLSGMFGEPEFIALDSSNPDAFYSGGIDAISDRYIGVTGGYYNGQPYKLFDRTTGEYLGTVGHIGRGPGEYLHTLNSFIDEKNGLIWLHDDPEKLLTYDLDTRKFIEDIPLAYRLGDQNYSKSDFIIDPDEKTITCARIPYPDDNDTIAAWKQDFDGNVIWAISEKGMYMAEDNIEAITMWLMTCENNIPGIMDISISSTDPVRDTLYIIEDGKRKPCFHLDYNDSDIKLTYTLLPDWIATGIQKPEQISERIIAYRHAETVLTDRKTGESFTCNIINDYLDQENAFPGAIFRHLAQTYDPVTFREVAENALENGKLSDTAEDRIRTILSGLSDDDNNIVILYRLK